MWNIHICILFLFYITFCSALIYDYYTGEKVTTKKIEYYKHANLLNTCTIDIKPCDPNEWRRVDRSCNCFRRPTKGTYLVPLPRVLPPDYYNGSYSRKAVSGKDLPLPRYVRTMLLAAGRTVSLDYTQAVPAFAVFMFMDIGSAHDIVNFAITTPNCCAKENRDNYMCTPNFIPADDPVHRWSGLRCMNLTRPMTHQSIGCTDNSLPSPIEMNTGVFDLSAIYNTFNKGDVVRSHKQGLLSYEIEEGKMWPPNGPRASCPLNKVAAGETRCFENYFNLVLGINMFVVWFMRHHNYIARELAKVNPCWSDEQLFQTARDINVAFALRMFTYEWMAQLIGKDNLIKHGVITCDGKFRDIYDSSKCPEVTLEYSFIPRWFHTIQDANARLYHTNGTKYKDFPMVELSLRSGFLPKNMEYLTQGMFRQPCGNIDHTVDPEISERGLPFVQHAVDVTASDLHKGRLLGLRPYVDYLKLCFGRNIKTFDDLIHDMDAERIELMKLTYDNVRDIDLMAGIWSEKCVEGGKIPKTMACLTIDQLKKSIKADRHWFERPNRPHAFCEPSWNPVVDCSEIPKINFSAWYDPECC